MTKRDFESKWKYISPFGDITTTDISQLLSSKTSNLLV
jgi:hypothetical protein